MKKISIYTLVLGFLLISIQACGPSEEERQAAQKARLDSLRQIEQQRIDRLMQARQDSIDMAQQQMQEEEPDMSGAFDEEGSFAVQVGAWRSEDKATDYISTLEGRDYPDVYTVKVGDESTGNVWFRVRVGYFSTKESAANLGMKLGEELNTGYWVSKVR